MDAVYCLESSVHLDDFEPAYCGRESGAGATGNSDGKE